MDKGTIVILCIIAILIIWLIYNFVYKKSTNDVMYNVKFVTMWGADQSINHPSNPHTGNMFLITHNSNFELFKVGQLASKGISNTSMYGTIDDLLKMVQNNHDIGSVVTNKVLMAPGEVNMTIGANSSKPILSFSTMIAPSSDWFTGFSTNLMSDNQWIKEITIPLYVYIAGTDSNQGFVTEHQPKNIPDPISLNQSPILYPNNQVKPIAYAVITKM
jgi:hypothetical protein